MGVQVYRQEIKAYPKQSQEALTYRDMKERIKGMVVLGANDSVGKY